MHNKKKLLTEDDFDIGLDYDGGGYGGFGLGGGNVEDMFSTFVQPFTDVVQTAVAAGLEVGNQALGFLKIAIGGVIASVTPFIDVEYDAIHAKTKERSAKIQSKFKDVFARTEKVLQDDHFKALLFLANPGAAIARTAAKITTKGAKIATGKGKEVYSDAKDTILGIIDGFEASAKKYESVGIKGKLLLEDKNLAHRVNNTKMAEEMKIEAIALTKERLEGFFNIVRRVEGAQSIQQLQQTLGFDKKILNQYKSIKQNDKSEIEQEMHDAAIDQVKNGVLGKLKEERKSFDSVKFDVSDITKLYDQAINTIENI